MAMDTQKPEWSLEAIAEMEGQIKNFEFVKMGERVDPQPGVFVVDVGNNLVEGVVDHHQIEGGQKSATSLVYENPQLVISWHKKEQIKTIATHFDPDFDACAATFITKYLVEHGKLPHNAKEIAEYADAGDYSRLKFGEHPEKTPYAIMSVIEEKFKSYWDDAQNKWIDMSKARMVRALELMQWISEYGVGEAAFAEGHPFAEEERVIKQDLEKYQQDLEASERLVVQMQDQERVEKPIDLVIVRNPKSVLFKDWFRNDAKNSLQGRGFEYLMVVLPYESGQNKERFIISVVPGKGFDLKGLGAKLDEEESKARVGMEDDPRKKGPPRVGYENADPWYDGRAHDYTVIGMPRSGTWLSFEQIKDLVIHPEKWQKS